MAINRGKYFEEWIDQSNLIYQSKKMAVIKKIPTPWQVHRKYNMYKKSYEIAYAHPSKSTVDFGGTASNQSIWFDAKVTQLKNSFPLKNIHAHQIDYLKDVDEQGGRAFLLIHSEHHKKTWLLWISDLVHFMNTSTRKSLPFTWLDENCSIVESKQGIILDYLPLVLAKEG
jgi:recombination protein U